LAVNKLSVRTLWFNQSLGDGCLMAYSSSPFLYAGDHSLLKLSIQARRG